MALFSRLPFSRAACIVSTAWVALLSSAVMGDVFQLKSGGQIEGAWLNRGESLTAPYRVQTTSGLVLQLARADVERVDTQRDAEFEYQRLAPKVADTVEQQWKLAQWCRERHLKSERQVHLERILKLDPDHLPARRALGYSQVSGEWLTQDEWRRRKGFIYHDGRWRLPQEIELREQLQEKRLAEKRWEARLLHLREMLTSDDALQARDELLAIDDPYAVKALGELLHRDTSRTAKLLYIASLTNVGNNPAAQALVVSSLADPDEEVRVACLDAIEELDPPGVAGFYIKALGSQNNYHVNRAAYALRRFGDDAAISPLINSLVTTHTFTLKSRPNASPDTITTSFVNDNRAQAGNAVPLMPSTGTNFSMGEGKKSVTRRIPNEEVLTTLVRLSGGPNYGYNQQAWRTWQESQLQAATAGGLEQ